MSKILALVWYWCYTCLAIELKFFSITVRPRAKRSEVEKRPDGSYRVSVTAPPVEGKANEAVTQALADYFNVPKSSIRITRGLSGKKKWVEIKGVTS